MNNLNIHEFLNLNLTKDEIDVINKIFSTKQKKFKSNVIKVIDIVKSQFPEKKANPQVFKEIINLANKHLSIEGKEIFGIFIGSMLWSGSREGLVSHYYRKFTTYDEKTEFNQYFSMSMNMMFISTESYSLFLNMLYDNGGKEYFTKWLNVDINKLIDIKSLENPAHIGSISSVYYDLEVKIFGDSKKKVWDNILLKTLKGLETATILNLDSKSKDKDYFYSIYKNNPYIEEKENIIKELWEKVFTITETSDPNFFKKSRLAIYFGYIHEFEKRDYGKSFLQNPENKVYIDKTETFLKSVFEFKVVKPGSEVKIKFNKDVLKMMFTIIKTAKHLKDDFFPFLNNYELTKSIKIHEKMLFKKLVKDVNNSYQKDVINLTYDSELMELTVHTKNGSDYIINGLKKTLTDIFLHSKCSSVDEAIGNVGLFLEKAIMEMDKEEINKDLKDNKRVVKVRKF